MTRRKLIALLGGAAAWPLAARAQQQPVRPLIAILSPLSAASAARNIAGFRSGLRDLGYLEGRNATLEIRYGDGAPERMAPLAQELVALKPGLASAGAETVSSERARPKALRAHLKSEIDRWTPIIKKAGVSAD